MAMSELGAYFQRHREEQGLSLEEVEARTRIRVKHLKQIESGEWEALPPGVYARGLLRNYARALGLSTARVLRMYVKERPSEARLPEPQLISQPLVRQPRVNLELVAALGLLAVAVGIFAWMVGTQLWPELQQVAGGRSGSYLTAVDMEDETPALPPPTAPASPTVDRRPAGTVRPLATPTPRATAAAVHGLELEVQATSDAWLMVQTDGQDAFMGFLRQGESRRWTARETLRLKTGNAGGTQVTLNGQPLPALGGSGDVETRVWRLLPNGDIEQSS